MSELPIPELRPGPPWVMEEMVAAEPDLARALPELRRASRGIAAAIRRTMDGSGRVSVVGCGTSEHAAMGVAALLDEAVVVAGGRPGSVVARQAFEAALEPWPDGLLVGISHEAETRATIAALDAARRLASATALITANPGGPAAASADHVLATSLLDRSWCHTVGYVSPLVAGAAIAAELATLPLDVSAPDASAPAASGDASAPDAVSRDAAPDAAASRDAAALEAHLRSGLGLAAPANVVARELWGVDRFVICGSGIDAIGARELALKIEEGVRLPAVARDLETELHGHLVSADERCGLIVLVTDPLRAGPRAARAYQLLLAGRRLGMRTAGILAAGAFDAWDPDATSAGRIRVDIGVGVPPRLAALTGAAIALQLLTIGLVHLSGNNPDRIRREDPDHHASADIVGASFPL